jgi:hypothetical protein
MFFSPALLAIALSGCQENPLMAVNIVSGDPNAQTLASPTIPAQDVGTGTFTFDGTKLAPIRNAVLGTNIGGQLLSGVVKATGGQLEIGGLDICPELRGIPGFDSCLVVSWQQGNAPTRSVGGPNLGPQVLQGYDSPTTNQIAIPLSLQAALASDVLGDGTGVASFKPDAPFFNIPSGTILNLTLGNASVASHVMAGLVSGSLTSIQTQGGLYWDIQASLAAPLGFDASCDWGAANPTGPCKQFGQVAQSFAVGFGVVGGALFVCPQLDVGISAGGTMDFHVGLIPSPRATPTFPESDPVANRVDLGLCPGNPDWTGQFGTTGRLHLPWMPQINAVVAGLPNGSDFANAAESSGSVTFPINAGAAVLDALLFGNVGNLECGILNGAGAGFNLPQAFTFSVYTQIQLLLQQAATQLFQQDNGPPPVCLPDLNRVKTCATTTNSAVATACKTDQVCLPPALVQWLGAAMTAVKDQWFDSAFGEYNSLLLAPYDPGPNGSHQLPGWLPNVDVSSNPSISSFEDANSICNVNDLTTSSPCDGADEQIVFAFDPDPDHDGIPTPLDLQPFCPGSSSADLDGDGIPDDCERCDFLNGAGPLSDVDGDMFVNGPAVPGGCNPVDNCTWVPNDGRNCNALVEKIQGVKPLGDACDPTACMLAQFNGSNTDFIPGNNSICVEPVDESTHPLPVTLNVWPLAEEFPPAGKTSFWCSSAATQTNVTANTTFWACLDTDQTKCTIDDTLAENPTSTTGHGPWLQMSVTGIDSGAVPNAGQQILYNVNALHLGTAMSWTWNWQSDFHRWNLSPKLYGSFPGVMWIHTMPHGNEDPLSNSYYQFALVGDPGCNTRSGPTTNPVNCSGGVCNMLLWTVAVVNPDPNIPYVVPSVVVPTLGGGFAALNGAAPASDVTAQVGTALQARLADSSLVWATSAEPALDMGVGTAFPMAAALSADGTRLVDFVMSTGGQLLAREDLPSVTVTNPVGVTADATLLADVPPPMHGFLTTLSRMRAAAYVVGGLDGSGVAQPIWKLRLVDQSWSTVGSFVPRNARAVTYSYNDSLYILDAPDTHTARIVAVGAQSGAVQELGRWREDEAGSIWDRSYLTTNYGGELVLAQSSSAQSVHRLVHIPLSQPAQPMMAEIGRGALVYQPLVERNGIALVVLDSQEEPTVKKPHDEKLSPVSWANLGDGSCQGPPGHGDSAGDQDN